MKERKYTLHPCSAQDQGFHLPWRGALVRYSLKVGEGSPFDAHHNKSETRKGQRLNELILQVQAFRCVI